MLHAACTRCRRRRSETDKRPPNPAVSCPEACEWGIFTVYHTYKHCVPRNQYPRERERAHRIAKACFHAPTLTARLSRNNTSQNLAAHTTSVATPFVLSPGSLSGTSQRRPETRIRHLIPGRPASTTWLSKKAASSKSFAKTNSCAGRCLGAPSRGPTNEGASGNLVRIDDRAKAAVPAPLQTSLLSVMKTREKLAEKDFFPF